LGRDAPGRVENRDTFHQSCRFVVPHFVLPADLTKILLTRPINIGRVNPGQGCPGAATSRVSPGRACTGLGGGPKYLEGIYGPD